MKTNEIIKETIKKLQKKVDKQYLKSKDKRNYQKINDLNESISALEKTVHSIYLNDVEIQSKLTRVLRAEKLIMQLPADHEGRNSWLLNYGIEEESLLLRKNKNLEFDEETQSCELAK
jgi:hypothetical protein